MKNITLETFEKNNQNEDLKRGLLLDTKPKIKKPSMYNVILLNDDYTPMEFVIMVLEKVFNKQQDEARQIMLHVHKKGIGICGTYTYEIAESKCVAVIDIAPAVAASIIAPAVAASIKASSNDNPDQIATVKVKVNVLSPDKNSVPINSRESFIIHIISVPSIEIVPVIVSSPSVPIVTIVVFPSDVIVKV